MYSGVYGNKGVAVRCLYLLVSLVVYGLTLGGWLFRRKWIVLCYHGILSSQRKRFEWQVKAAAGRNRQKVKFTFDDAFANLLDNAMPVLSERKLAALIFAVPGNLGDSPQWNIAADHTEYHQKTMTAQQLIDIQSYTIKIGSHTQTHPDLSKLPPDQVRWELVESKKNLEQLLGAPVVDLALPHGAYNQDVLEIAQKAGYKRIYTLDLRLADNPLPEGVIGRFSMSPDVWPIEFHLTCAGAYVWLYSFRMLLQKVRRK